MVLSNERPHGKAFSRDGGYWLIAPECVDDLLAHWTGGKAFWRGKSPTGAEVVVKLADITGVSIFDQAAIDLELDESAERKRREVVEG